MRLAAVIAANGTGHFRRCVGVLDRLTATCPEVETTLFCTRRQIEIMRGWSRLANVRARGARVVTDVACGFDWPLRRGPVDLLGWRDRLADHPAFRRADAVVSDNLAGVLALRSETVLLGSFLWSDVLAAETRPDARRFVADEVACLAAARPPMLCVGPLATEGVLNATTPVRLPWMCDRPVALARSLVGRARIGIAGGTTGAARTEVAHLVRALAPSYRVTVDGSVSTSDLEGVPGVQLGLLRTVPLSAVDMVLCRPGMGTVTDCVAENVPFLTFHEPNSPEMAHTAQRLAELGIAGELPPSCAGDQVAEAVAALANPRNYRSASLRLADQDKSGLQRAADWLAQRFGLSPVT